MPLTARVQNGRLVLDEPTDLPEGQVVQLVAVNDSKELNPADVELRVLNTEGDDLSDEQRAKLHESLKVGYVQAKAGKLIPGDEMLRKLRSR